MIFAELIQNFSVPEVVFLKDLRLDLLIVHQNKPELFLSLRVIEGFSPLFDIDQ
jgi:hypothetical protein